MDGVGPRRSKPWGSTVIISCRMAISRVAMRCFGQDDFGKEELPSISLNRERILFLPLGMKSLPAGGSGFADNKRCFSMVEDLAWTSTGSTLCELQRLHTQSGQIGPPDE